MDEIALKLEIERADVCRSLSIISKELIITSINTKPTSHVAGET